MGYCVQASLSANTRCWSRCVRGVGISAHVHQPTSTNLEFLVDGQPVSALTIDSLAWCAEQAAAQEMTTLVQIWDNAGWHVSRQMRDWLRQHNQQVARTGHGVRLAPC